MDEALSLLQQIVGSILQSAGKMMDASHARKILHTANMSKSRFGAK